MDFMKLLQMAGGSGGGGGGPMEMLSSLFGGGKGQKQQAPELPQAAPMPNLLPQGQMQQPFDVQRLRQAVANRPPLGMR